MNDDIEQITRAVCAAIDIDSKITAEIVADVLHIVADDYDSKLEDHNSKLEDLNSKQEALEARINRMIERRAVEKPKSIFCWLFGR